jgi:hypothetical protein
MTIYWVPWFKTKILIIIWRWRGANLAAWSPGSPHCTAAVCSCYRHEPISVTGAATCHKLPETETNSMICNITIIYYNKNVMCSLTPMALETATIISIEILYLVIPLQEYIILYNIRDNHIYRNSIFINSFARILSFIIWHKITQP